jgi:23S rRNA pseudouridine1911/1915/1917 synthase
MKRVSESDGIEILYEDDVLVAAVKPAGLPTANAPAGRSSLYTWLKARWGTAAFVGIVSRLDAPVSGVVVVAKTPAAAAALAEQFRTRDVAKRYLAVVTGRFPAPLAQWAEWHDHIIRGEGSRPSLILQAGAAGGAAAGRTRAGQGRGAARGGPPPHDADPQDAAVRVRVVRRAGEVSLVELQPLTGRRHQLRAQLAARGCPIVGDRLYGSRLPFPAPGGIALHATSLTIRDPATGQERTFSAPAAVGWREAFPSLWATLGGS